MHPFPPLEDQLDLIAKGAAEILPLDALEEEFAQSYTPRTSRRSENR